MARCETCGGELTASSHCRACSNVSSEPTMMISGGASEDTLLPA